MVRIIAFVGAPASGKTEAADVAREEGIPVVVMGDVIREELHRRGLPLSDENAGRVASELRAREGMDAIARRCIPKIKRALRYSDVVVIDGIRGIAEVEALKREFGGDFLLVCIDAPLEIRYERILKRGRGDDTLSIEEFMRREARENAWGMREAMRNADIVVRNNCSLEEFRRRIKEIIDLNV